MSMSGQTSLLAWASPRQRERVGHGRHDLQAFGTDSGDDAARSRLDCPLGRRALPLLCGNCREDQSHLPISDFALRRSRHHVHLPAFGLDLLSALQGVAADLVNPHCREERACVLYQRWLNSSATWRPGLADQAHRFARTEEKLRPGWRHLFSPQLETVGLLKEAQELHSRGEPRAGKRWRRPVMWS